MPYLDKSKKKQLLTRYLNKSFSDIALKLTVVVAIIFSLFQIYAVSIGLVGDFYRNVIHLTLIMIIIFLKAISSDKNCLKFVDILFLFCTLFCISYLLANFKTIVTVRGAIPNKTDIIIGAIFIICLLEALRKTTGLVLPLLVLSFILYMRFGNMLPKLLSHGGFTWERIIFRAFLTNEGIWGTTIGISSTYITLFVLFSTLLELSGASEYFNTLALSIAKGRKASAAWSAVIGSALMGTISGSAAANVASTGCITIPLMKKIGFSPAEAGGIEAAASSGGPLMPPIMGAAAFIIPNYLGITYLQVIKSAAIPAIIYFLVILINIEIISGKRDFKNYDFGKISINKLFKEGIIYFTPIIILIYFLISGKSANYAATASMVILILIIFLKERSLVKMKFIINALEKAAFSMIQIAVICGAAGIIVQVVNATGIGSVLSHNIKMFCGENVLLMLFLIALITTILSMGMPATALYIILASTIAPTLINFGILPLAAHLFIFWYGMIASITPPVALASYTASALSGAGIWPVSLEAFRYGIVGFLAPYVFVFSPALILLGDSSLLDIIFRTIITVIGFASISIALHGWVKEIVPFYLRLTAFVAGILMLFPNYSIVCIGILLFSIMLIIQISFIYKRKRKHINKIYT